MGHDEYDRYARRIERWPGVSVRDRLPTGRNGHIIDFEMGWPGTVYAEPDEIRYGATEASAVIFDSPDRVDTWQLRLPQIPAAGNPEDDTRDTLEARLRPDPGRPIQVRMADGTQAWTPHVEPQGFSVATRDPDTTLDDIQSMWSAYRDLAEPDGVIP